MMPTIPAQELRAEEELPEEDQGQARRPDGERDESSRHLAGLGSGFFVGTLASLMLGWSDYHLAPPALFTILAGGLIAGIRHRSVLTPVGVFLAFYFWAGAQDMIPPYAPVECTANLCAQTLPGWFVILASFVALVAYLVSLGLRFAGHMDAAPRSSIALGLVAVLALVATFASLGMAPESFAIQPPTGWSSFGRSYYAPEIGADARWTPSGQPDDTNWDDTGPSVPTLAVSVVRYSSDSLEPATPETCLYSMQTWAAHTSWLYARDRTGYAVPVPNAAGIMVTTPSGAHVYAFAVQRTRTVGFLPQHLCYVVVMSVPPGYPEVEAQVPTVFATFRLR